jgi:DNA-binding NarL/FixJ family response regulator
VVLMDLRMPGTDGVSAIGRLAERGVTARVLVLTTDDTDSAHPRYRGRLPARRSRPT